MPAGTSLSIIKCDGNIVMTYDANATQEPIKPLTDKRQVPITVSYAITGLFAKQAAARLSGRIKSFIDLSIEEAPDWCTASVSPNVVSTDIDVDFKSIQAIVTISVNENAPAFSDGVVKIRLHARKILSLAIEVREVTLIADIRFYSGYVPIIGFSVPKGNFMEVSPMSTANFDIHLENLGNAKTDVICKVLNVPKDWSPNIISKTTLGAKVLGEDPTSTIQLVVKPPYGFGYHNERETIQVSLTPLYYGDPSIRGQEYILTFTVQSRGFSTPGFEAVLLIFALAGFALISKKRNKT